MDLNKSLKKVIDTGNVCSGTKQSCKAIGSGNVKLIILSSNCPKETVTFASESKTPIHSFQGNNSVLGAACGKPFPISVITVLDAGKSDILSVKTK